MSVKVGLAVETAPGFSFSSRCSGERERRWRSGERERRRRSGERERRRRSAERDRWRRSRRRSGERSRDDDRLQTHKEGAIYEEIRRVNKMAPFA